jgi:hypothetical protein
LCKLDDGDSPSSLDPEDELSSAAPKLHELLWGTLRLRRMTELERQLAPRHGLSIER